MYFLGVLGQFAAAHPWVMAANVVFLAALPMNDILLPHLYGRLVDAIKNRRTFMGVFATIVAVLVAVQGLSLLSDWHDTFMTPAFQGFVRTSILRTLFDHHQTAYSELSIGHLLTLLIKSPNTLLSLFNQVKDHLLPYVALFVSAIAYFSSFDWVLSVVIACVVALLIALLVISPRSCAGVSAEKASLYSRLQDEVDDLLRNLLSVYTTDRVEPEIERINGFDREHQLGCRRTMRCALMFKAVGFPIIIALLAFFMYRCHTLVARGRMGTGAFVSLLLIVLSMTSNLMWCVDVIRDIVFDYGFLVHAERQLAQSKLLPRAGGSATPPPHADGAGLSHVSFRYPGMPNDSLSDVTFHFKPGERVVVVGPIGAGKSTLTKLMAKLLLPTRGDLYLNGRWYADMTPSEVRRHVGYVPQQPVLFNRSVYENLRYGNDASDADIDALVADLDVAREFEALPEGMRTVIGKGGSKLSGGQRQLVWCLRTLLSAPEVVLMDEPTASMDDATKRTLERVLDKLTENKIVIIISHDEFMVRQATRVVHLA